MPQKVSALHVAHTARTIALIRLNRMPIRPISPPASYLIVHGVLPVSERTPKKPHVRKPDVINAGRKVAWLSFSATPNCR